jgi:hypothetical protein
MSKRTDSGIPVYQACTNSHLRVKITVLSENPNTKKVHVVKEVTEDIELGYTRTYTIGATNINAPVGIITTEEQPTYATLGLADTDGTKFKDCKIATYEDTAAYRDTTLYRNYIRKSFSDRKAPPTTGTGTEEEKSAGTDKEKELPAFVYVLTEVEQEAKRLRDIAYAEKLALRRALAIKHGFDPDTDKELEKPCILSSSLRAQRKIRKPVYSDHSSEEEISEPEQRELSDRNKRSRKRAELDKTIEDYKKKQAK